MQLGIPGTVPTGCTIISGADTNTITVDFGLSSSPGTITVLGTDTCGSGALSSLGITLYDRPVITISGTASSCTDQTYTYETQAGMTQYLWTVSPGTSVASGGGSGDSTITVSWNTMGIYWIGVNYTNPYGCDALSSIQENIQVNQSDSVKVSISASQNNVCAGTSIIYIAVPTNGGTDIQHTSGKSTA